MKINVPIILTFLRIFLIPVFIFFFYFPLEFHYYITAALFTLAAITDWLDGFLARKLQQVSSFGAFLDPVADKLIVIVALMLLVAEQHNIYLTIPAIIIVIREITISALREWMAELGKRTKVQVAGLGKIKTASQMVSIVLLLSQASSGFTSPIVWAGYVLLYLAVILTIWSMVLYLMAAVEFLE